MKKALFVPLQITLCTVGYLYASSSITYAQVTSDGTVNTQVNQDGNVAEITGGETRGGNLFHSFQDFSVGTGNEAFFNNADSISNIFSRVTGGRISNIDGVIRAKGDASLFLINPAGIIFGRNARLDIGGSFYSSTASSILFEDGEFSAADLENPPLLTVNAPIGLGFRDEPGDIVNRSRVDSSGLQVTAGENIALLGGNINLEGGFVTAPEGTITLGGLSTTGEISITETNSFVFPEEIANSDVFLTERAEVNVRGEVGGLIQVNANNLEIIEESNFLAGIPLNAGSPNVQSRDINLNLNNLIISGNSNVRNETLGIGNAGNINITTGDLNLTEGAAIIASTFGQGNGGDVKINATGDVSIDQDFGGIHSNVGVRKDEREPNVANVVGDAGDITISANSFSLTNGGRLSTKTAGLGNAGNVEINATDRVLLDGKGTIPIEADNFTFNIATAILTQVETENEEGTTFSGTGNAGNIEINAGSLLVTSAEGQFFGPQINTDNRGGLGNAGNIEINVTDSIVFEGTALIDTQIEKNAVGDAGDINITTDSLTMRDDSLLITSSDGEGDPGNINITATEQVLIDGNNRNDGVKLSTQVLSNGISKSAGNINIQADSLFLDNRAFLLSETRGNGNGGNISIQANSFLLDNRSILSSVTRGNGNAGDIIVNAEQQIVIDGGSQFLSQVFDGAEGNAGNIQITTSQLSLNDFSQISSNTQEGATGDAGSTSIVTKTLTLTGGSTIDATTDNNFSGGSIDITASQIELSESGKIVTSTSRRGNAGSIKLNVSGDILIDNSNPLLDAPFIEEILQDLKSNTGIFASTGEESNGNGGSVQLTVSDQVSIKNGGKISVENQGQGNGGNLFIQANTIDLNNNASISAATTSGTGSNIKLRTFDDITLRENSFISAEAAGNARSGNITIDSQFIIAFPSNTPGSGNDILANANQGNGGNITINAESLFGIQERSLNSQTNDINASSEFSLDGNITINTPYVNPLQGVAELPNNVVEPQQTTTQACGANREIAENGLIIKGKGSVIQAPGLPLNSHNIFINGENTDATASIPQPIETAQGKIQPARGVKVTESGEVILTAYRTNNSGERIPETRNCG